MMYVSANEKAVSLNLHRYATALAGELDVGEGVVKAVESNRPLNLKCDLPLSTLELEPAM
jgi:hypothetical protein